MPRKAMPLKKGTYGSSDGYRTAKRPDHRGVDYAADQGVPIYASADGVVVEGAERAPGSVTGFGNWVWIDCQEGYGVDLIYGHMRHQDILVRAGDRVVAGQMIARVGNEGESFGPHLHFEVWGPPGRIGGLDKNPTAWLEGAGEPATPTASSGGRMENPVTRTQAWSPNKHQGDRNVWWVAIHTQQGRGKAPDIINYLMKSSAQVSYNAVVDDTETVLIVPWDWNPWSASNANNRADHILMAGTYAEWTQGKWLETDASDGVNEDMMLTRTAALVAWRCQERGIPLEYVGGGSKPPTRKGVCGHVDFGQWGGGHTDPGPNFPWAELMKRAKAFAGGLDMALTEQLVNFEGKKVDVATVLFWLDKRAMQNERMLMALLDQVLGEGAGQKIRDAAPNAKFSGWTQNGGRSLNDTVAAIAAASNVEGTADTKAKK